MKRHIWTTEETDLLKAKYADMQTAKLAAMLSMTIHQVYTKASAMHLKKSPEFLASADACRLRRGDNIGLKYQFKPGQSAWNKGIKFDSGGRSHETRFKPGILSGNAAKNIKQIGHERIDRDGYLQRKINNDMPFYKRWRAVHILIWEEVNGPLPSGSAIIFKDGNKTNLQIDNLECITRAELMKRNSFHNYGKEIAQLVQLRSVITRQINKRERAKA